MVESMKTVRVASFSKYPGGRFASRGGVRAPYSGEEFRESVLRPALNEADVVTVDFVGAVTVIPSFVDEALGPFVEKMGKEEFRRRVKWKVDPASDVLRFIEDTIAKRS